MYSRFRRSPVYALAMVASFGCLLLLTGIGCDRKPSGEEGPSRPGDGSEHPSPPSGDQSPVVAADRLERPFNPAKWDEYYSACTSSPQFADNHKSSRLLFPKADPTISLVLVPHATAYKGTESELRVGRFVGVIRNSLSGTLPEHNIEGGTAAAPSTTCVWVEQVPNQTNYQAWFVSKTKPANPAPRPYERAMHLDNPLMNGICRHSIPAAAWYPKGLDATYGCEGKAATSAVFAQDVTPVDKLMLDVFMYTLWFTCDLTGCCRNA